MKKQLGFDVARILKTLKYIIIIERNPETGYYVGQCKQVPEAFSQGRTVDELMNNMKEAISLAIECRDEELRERYKDKEVFGTVSSACNDVMRFRIKNSHADRYSCRFFWDICRLISFRIYYETMV